MIISSLQQFSGQNIIVIRAMYDICHRDTHRHRALHVLSKVELWPLLGHLCQYFHVPKIRLYISVYHVYFQKSILLFWLWDVFLFSEFGKNLSSDFFSAWFFRSPLWGAIGTGALHTPQAWQGKRWVYPSVLGSDGRHHGCPGRGKIEDSECPRKNLKKAYKS